LAEEVLYTETITPDDPNIVNLSVVTDYKNLNMRTFFNSGGNTATSDTVFTLTIGQGFNVYSETVGLPALVTGDWPAGATINLVVNGLVAGRGGDGGKGGDLPYTGSGYISQNGSDGHNGEVAIAASYPLNITIGTSGIIAGGGGGGGGWASDTLFNPLAGVGGGGGQGISIGGLGGTRDASPFGDNEYTAISGTNGNLGAAGVSGDEFFNNNAGDGGGFGEVGIAGFDGFDGLATGGAGGLAGPAINKNGNTVNITNNGTIKGVINA